MKIPLDRLPSQLDPFAAVEAAYAPALARVDEAIRSSLSVLIECDKELVPYLYAALRGRWKRAGRQAVYLDGRGAETSEGAAPPGLLPRSLAMLRDAVRGAVDNKILVLPHLDLLTTSTGSPTSEAREVIGLLYENPNALVVGFRDPSFPIPTVLENLFPHHEHLTGIERARLPKLITQSEAMKFGDALSPYALYKHVSGINAVRLRRLLAGVVGEDYPDDPSAAYAQLRRGTLTGGLSVPDVSLRDDIGGYAAVKQRLTAEILDILAHKESLSDPDAVTRVEALLPRGMIFWGPPGTGKTLFAKAMASSLGAAVLVVSGPELKSKWHGESEQNIRRVFLQARAAAPSILIFDELDAIASARGSTGDNGVGHSMVNQLLTELDGFRSNEMVFVVGTTNFPSSLDPALTRPGRFEFKLHVSFPDAVDRREILIVHAERFGLDMTDAALDHAVDRTAGLVEDGSSRYTGDHLAALCRAIARRRIRTSNTGPTLPEHVDDTLEEYVDRPVLTARERTVVATHEAGHAIVALHCAHLPPIDRISIRGDLGGTLGYVAYADSLNQHVQTRDQLLDRIAVLYGGREAEDLILDDLSMGSAHDLEQATSIARWLTERLALDEESPGVRQWADDAPVSEQGRAHLEERVLNVLRTQRSRARAILEANVDQVRALTASLLADGIVEAERLDSYRSALGS